MLCCCYGTCNGTHTFSSVHRGFVSKCLEDHKDVFWQNWDEPLCSILLSFIVFNNKHLHFIHCVFTCVIFVEYLNLSDHLQHLSLTSTHTHTSTHIVFCPLQPFSMLSERNLFLIIWTSSDSWWGVGGAEETQELYKIQ